MTKLLQLAVAVCASMTGLVAAAPAGARVLPVQTPPQDAGVAGEQARVLGECMVASTTGADRIAVTRWMLGATASAPQMKGLVTIDPAQKVAADKKMAEIFTRLLSVDCVTQARPLFTAQNRKGFETAGGALGQIAVRDLIANPDAEKALEAYVQYLKDSDFAAVIK